jgi:ribosomal protein S18 acetylase RimI-like enzyme
LRPAGEASLVTDETTIRRLRADELDRFVERLWRPFAEEMAELDRAERLDDDVDVHSLAVEHRRERLAEDGVAQFVAERGDDLVGQVHVGEQSAPPVFARGDAAHVVGLYVRPEHRGAGLGSRLLDRAEAWARERDHERVTLSVSLENDAARRLYDERGYEPVRERRRLAL